MRVEKKVCARCGKRLPLGNFMLAANDLRLCAGGALKHGSFNPPLNLIKCKNDE